MLFQYFAPAAAVEWQKKLESVTEASLAAEEFFGNAWKTESAWQWLENVKDEMARFDFSQTVSNKSEAFFLAMLEQINWEMVAGLTNEIDAAAAMIEDSQRGVIGQTANLEAWRALGERLDLNKSGIELLFAKVFSRPDAVQSKINRQLTMLAESYEKFRLEFRLVAAALLYYSPAGGPTRLADIEKDSETPVVDWAPVLRLLGQAIHSRDGEVLAWAGKFLYVNAAPTKRDVFESTADRLLFITLLHLSLGNFSELNEWRQARAMEWYLWGALCFGVLIEKELREYLAGRPLLSDYIVHSGGFSELLHYSAQLVFVGGDQTTIGGFIKGFLSFTKGDGRDAADQDLYISQAIKEHKWPTDLKFLLQKLLHLFVHLRDCDFIDYRGWLAEEQIVPSKYDWKKIIRRDISDKDSEDYREYFRLLDRPAFLKAELITAFESVPYEDEPYLDRVARLSDLYMEVFPSLDYSPIMYFDEQAGKIKFDKKLPDSWYTPWFKFGVDESVWKEAHEEAKKKFSNLPENEELEFE